MPGVTCAMIAGQAVNKSPGRANDTVSSDNRTSKSDDNKNYHFGRNPKIKRMLVV